MYFHIQAKLDMQSAPESKKRPNDEVKNDNPKPDTARHVKTKIQVEKQDETVDEANLCLGYNQKFKNIESKMKNSKVDFVSVTGDLSCRMLVMVTNNVKKSFEKNIADNKSYANFNIVPLRILGPSNQKAPFEPKSNGEKKLPGIGSINPKHRLYTDKDGNVLDEHPAVPLCEVKKLEENVAMFRSFHKHPNNALKNVCRGKSTDFVGVIEPGIPLCFFIFEDNKGGIMENEKTECELIEFSFAIVGVRIRDDENCKKGYGITVKKIVSLPDFSPGIYSHYPFTYLYNDKECIKDQTKSRIERHNYFGPNVRDVGFIQKCIKSNEDSEDVYERPLISITPSADASYCVREQANGDYIELVISDDDSIYNNLCMKVNIVESQFDMSVTPKKWISMFYNWCLGAGVAKIVVLHSEWIFKKCKEGDTQYLLDACVVVDESKLFTQNPSVLFNPVLSSALLPMINIKEATNSKQRYSAWCCLDKASTSEKYVVIMDDSKLFTSTQTELSNVNTIQKSNVFYILNKNMHVDVRVWVGYLCLFRDDKVVFQLPVGINAFTNTQGVIDMPSSVSDIYTNPWNQ